MHIQPLQAEHLFAAQRIAADLFPWEQEHAAALAASVRAEDQTTFCAARRLSGVRSWTTHEAGGAVCGVAALYYYQAQADEAWLAWFGLVPAARGQGGGTRLLEFVIAELRRERRHTLRLWTTDESEYAAATQFYLHRGFAVEDHPPLPGEDWRTLVFSLGLEGRPAIPWSAVLDRGELCGRQIPVAPAAAA